MTNGDIDRFMDAIADVPSPIDVIKQHVPSLTEQDENDLDNLIGNQLGTLEPWDHADFALRTCACGVRIDGYYTYVDHLITVFGGESHIGS